MYEVEIHIPSIHFDGYWEKPINCSDNCHIFYYKPILEDFESLAEDWLEFNHPEVDYCDELEIWVRIKNQPETQRKILVKTEPSVIYTAYEIE